MIEQDDDYSTLHQEDRAKKEIFREDAEPKKKKATKAKARKPKSESDTAKGVVVLPLSMLPQTDEDRAMYTNKTAANKASKAPKKPYDPKAPARFAVGDAITHKNFGVGFVALEVGVNKMEVLFESGRKLLIQAPRPKQ